MLSMSFFAETAAYQAQSFAILRLRPLQFPTLTADMHLRRVDILIYQKTLFLF